MADKKISQLTSLAQGDIATTTDVLAIVDTSATETKKATAAAIVGAAASAGLTNVDINSGAIDGTAIGASSASTGAFTTLTTSSTVTLNGGTANGVLYLNGSKVATSGSALTYNGTGLGIGVSSAAAPVEIVYAASGQQVAQRWRSGAGNTYGLDFVGNNADNGWGQIATYASGYLYWGVSATAGTYTELMRLTSTGLGIGTSSPAVPLDVVSNSGSNGINIRVRSSNDYGFLNFKSNDGSDTAGSIAALRAGVNSGSLLFYTGTTEKARLDTSGNLGLGVTPSAWSQGKGFEVLNAGYGLWNGSGSPASIYMMANAYFNGGWKYGGTGQASHYYQYLGQHIWSTAASGTAGNAISFTQAMTLDASSNLSVATTSTYSAYAKLHVLNGLVTATNGTDGGVYIGATTGGTELAYLSMGRSYNLASTGEIALATTGAKAILFGTNNTQRATITAAGKFLVGQTTININNNNIAEFEGSCGLGLKSTGGSAFSGLQVWNNATSGDNLFVEFLTDTAGTGRGTIDYNRAGGQVRYNTTSDYRAKEIYGSVEDSGEQIDALKVYRGKMHGATQERPMMIAHEAQEVVPYAVGGEKDAVNKDGTPKYQTIDHQILVPLLIAELQSLRKRVAELEAK